MLITIDESLNIGDIPISNLDFKSGNHYKFNITDITHKNYLEYLSACWYSHLGVIISPDIIWNICLCEISSLIKESPEKYRVLFTDSNEKKEIIVQYNDPRFLPMGDVVKQLKRLVPTDIDTFLPKFSTTDKYAEFCHQSSFCDAVSPYYNYSMYLCGIRKVKILGTIEDWNLVWDHLGNMSLLFPEQNVYFEKVMMLIDRISTMYSSVDVEFLKNIFSLDRCGSDSQVVVKGWVTDLFIKVPSIKYIGNFSSCVSTVEYSNLSLGTKHKLFSGLLSSKIVRDYLVPQFGFVTYDVEL